MVSDKQFNALKRRVAKFTVVSSIALVIMCHFGEVPLARGFILPLMGLGIAGAAYGIEQLRRVRGK